MGFGSWSRAGKHTPARLRHHRLFRRLTLTKRVSVLIALVAVSLLTRHTSGFGGGLARVQLGGRQRFVFGSAFGTTVVMTIGALLTGAI